MTYYKDLSKYVYSDSVIPDFNVGWLSRWLPFPRGAASSEFVECLGRQVKFARSATRGRHTCPFCGVSCVGGRLISVRISGRQFDLGAAEMHIFSRTGEVFSAPDLIFHYVQKHGYRPPSEFIEAVIDCGAGCIPGAMLGRLRELVVEAPRIEDRVDAAIDLMQISPRESVPWLEEITASPTCDPYFQQKVVSALQML